MASGNDRHVALLSIRPRFVDAIADGRKLVEFRRQAFARPVSHIVVYATQPIGKIVCVLVVGAVVQGSRDSLWGRYKSVAGLRREEFMRYMAGAAMPTAIEIRRVEILSRPMSLNALGEDFTPPQSFRYLTTNVLANLERTATSAAGAMG